MLFIMMTLCFTVAILLAMGIAAYIAMIPIVQKWYMRWLFKQMEKTQKMFDEIEM